GRADGPGRQPRLPDRRAPRDLAAGRRRRPPPGRLLAPGRAVGPRAPRRRAAPPAPDPRGPRLPRRRAPALRHRRARAPRRPGPRPAPARRRLAAVRAAAGPPAAAAAAQRAAQRLTCPSTDIVDRGTAGRGWARCPTASPTPGAAAHRTRAA